MIYTRKFNLSITQSFKTSSFKCYQTLIFLHKNLGTFEHLKNKNKS